MDKIQIRKMEPSELPQVQALFEKVYREIFSIHIPSFSDTTNGEQIYVAVLEETIVGMATVWEADAFIHYLFVDKDARGKGGGTNIVKCLAGIYEQPLKLKCLLSNEKARAFYDASGWIEEKLGDGADGPYALMRYCGKEQGRDNPMKLKLIHPCEEYKNPIISMLDAWLQVESPEDITPWSIVRLDHHDFNRYCRELDVREERDGLVPDITLFCYDEVRNQCVGAVNIRLKLTDRLLRSGGHIGDGICPSERGKGYGTKMLALALKECEQRGLRRILMVCEKDNIPSVKAIRHNGGRLENEIEEDGCVLQRYWIDCDEIE